MEYIILCIALCTVTSIFGVVFLKWDAKGVIKYLTIALGLMAIGTVIIDLASK